MKQSLSLKKVVSNLLVLFFVSTYSENPFDGNNAFSKYSLEVIESPS